MAETKSLHMQNRAGPNSSQASGLHYTYKIGQNVVVTTTVLPQGHNLWEGNIDTVNYPWDENKRPCFSSYSNLCQCSHVLRGSRTALHSEQSKVCCGIGWERDGLIKGVLVIREGKRNNVEPSLNILLTLKSFMVLESSATVGQKVAIGEKKYFKGIYSETVRCRSHSALKISHLWCITACFNPHSLSENSKRCSKPFHHCGTNHMLSFIWEFVPPFVLSLHINQIEKLHIVPAFFKHYMLDKVVRRTSLWFVIYDFAVCCGWTSEWLPCRNMSATAQFFSSAIYKHSNTSLQQNQHVCTCSGPGPVTKANHQLIVCFWARVQLQTLAICYCSSHSRWVEGSDDKLTCTLKSQCEKSASATIKAFN